jgi:hypothetical protein
VSDPLRKAILPYGKKNMTKGQFLKKIVQHHKEHPVKPSGGGRPLTEQMEERMGVAAVLGRKLPGSQRTQQAFMQEVRDEGLEKTTLANAAAGLRAYNKAVEEASSGEKPLTSAEKHKAERIAAKEKQMEEAREARKTGFKKEVSQERRGAAEKEAAAGGPAQKTSVSSGWNRDAKTSAASGQQGWSKEEKPTANKPVVDMMID